MTLGRYKSENSEKGCNVYLESDKGAIDAMFTRACDEDGDDDGCRVRVSNGTNRHFVLFIYLFIKTDMRRH